MILRWYGHDCFLFYSKKRSRILTDPFGKQIRYPFPPLTAEIILISHEHPDHNAAWRVMGEPFIVKRTSTGPCEFEIPLKSTEETYLFKGIPTFHDEVLGRKHGPNTVFTWEMDGCRICHLGDLGHTLSPSQVQSIGKIDLLLLPVGGGSVITPNEAVMVIDALQPKLIIPTHYKTPEVDGDFVGVDEFLKLMTSVEQMKTNQLEVSALPSSPTVVRFELGAAA